MVSLEFFIYMFLPAALWPWEPQHPATLVACKGIAFFLTILDIGAHKAPSINVLNIPKVGVD
jgi:hypothetical protein